MMEQVKWDERGLAPVIVQDANTKQVLTLAYMNAESLRKTLEIGETVFWSRSRNELWHKGATSGNIQKVREIRVDCDGTRCWCWSNRLAPRAIRGKLPAFLLCLKRAKGKFYHYG